MEFREDFLESIFYIEGIIKFQNEVYLREKNIGKFSFIGINF